MEEHAAARSSRSAKASDSLRPLVAQYCRRVLVQGPGCSQGLLGHRCMRTGILFEINASEISGLHFCVIAGLDLFLLRKNSLLGNHPLLVHAKQLSQRNVVPVEGREAVTEYLVGLLFLCRCCSYTLYEPSRVRDDIVTEGSN